MRIVWLIVIFVSTLYTAEVDKRFFSQESKEAYLSGMEINITQNRDKDSAQLESALLRQIKDQDKKTFQNNYKKEEVDLNATFTPAEFEKMLMRYIEAEQNFQQSKNKIEQLTIKLDYVKQLIKNITTEEKEKLLTYQLQYTLYKQFFDYESNKVDMLEQIMAYNKEIFVKMIPRIKSGSYEDSLKRLSENKSVLNVLMQQKAELDVKIEQDRLLESKRLNEFQSEEKILNEKLDKSLIVVSQSELSIALLQLVLKKDELFYDSLKKADQHIALITSVDKEILESNLQLLKSLGKSYFGVTSVAVIASKESITDSINYLLSLLHKPLFVFNEKAVTSADILKVVLIFLVGIFLASIYRRRMLRWSVRAKVLANFGYYTIILITFFVAINSVGFDLSTFSMFASALAIGIGFGLQTVVSNMVSGIIMMFERSVRVGDFVELNDTLRGRVTDMRIRSTVIKTLDNIDIVVPNSSFIQNNVVNLTLEDTMRRLHVPFGVAYGTKVERVIQIILDELAQSELHYYKGHDEDRQPLVRMIGMGASSVDYELLVWIDWDNKKQASTKSDFLILIYNALYKHHIEIPFPQLDLHVKSMEQKP